MAWSGQNRAAADVKSVGACFDGGSWKEYIFPIKLRYFADSLFCRLMPLKFSSQQNEQVIKLCVVQRRNFKQGQPLFETCMPIKCVVFFC